MKHESVALDLTHAFLFRDPVTPTRLVLKEGDPSQTDPNDLRLERSAATHDASGRPIYEWVITTPEKASVLAVLEALAQFVTASVNWANMPHRKLPAISLEMPPSVLAFLTPDQVGRVIFRSIRRAFGGLEENQSLRIGLGSLGKPVVDQVEKNLNKFNERRGRCDLE